MAEKLCNTCVFQETSSNTTVCQTCTRGGVPDAPHWKARHYADELPGAGWAKAQASKLDEPEGADPGGPLPPDGPPVGKTKSDGSTASYYVLPEGAKELQDLISYRDMNSQIGEIFRACYRYGMASHSDRLRDAKKIKFYAEAEIARLEKYGE